MGLDETVIGSPVHARPISLARRGQRWGWCRIRRNLFGATLTSGSSPQGGEETHESSRSDDACRNAGHAWATRSVVAGIGFRHGAAPDEIVALIYRALSQIGSSSDHLATIATAEDRADEEPIREAAAAFGLVPIGIQPSALIAVDAHVPTRSGRIEASRGIGSVAEAAALAASGEGGALVLARIASPSVTCALAIPAHFATQAQ